MKIFTQLLIIMLLAFWVAPTTRATTYYKKLDRMLDVVTHRNEQTSNNTKTEQLKKMLYILNNQETNNLELAKNQNYLATTIDQKVHDALALAIQTQEETSLQGKKQSSITDIETRKTSYEKAIYLIEFFMHDIITLKNKIQSDLQKATTPTQSQKVNTQTLELLAQCETKGNEALQMLKNSLEIVELELKKEKIPDWAKPSLSHKWLSLSSKNTDLILDLSQLTNPMLILNKARIKEIFEYLSVNDQITKLKLSGQKQLSAVNTELFDKLKNMTELYVMNCDLTTTHINKILTLPNLQKLYLSGNNAAQVSPELFQNLRQITELHINNCSLTTDQIEQILQLPLLQYLDLSENTNLKDVPLKLFDKLPKISKLNVSACDLTTKQIEKIFTLTTLKDLNISNNKNLESVAPKFFGLLTNLEKLDINGFKPNKKQIKAILTLSNLQKLNITGQGLTK